MTGTKAVNVGKDRKQPQRRGRPREIDSSRLDSLVGYNLRRAQMVEYQYFAAYFAPHDIRPVQYAILVLVQDNPALNQSELARALDIKRANMVTLINELEGRGLVTREPSTTDRRAHTLGLTAAGEAMTNRLVALHDQLEAELLKNLGQDSRDQLLSLLRSLRTP